MAIVQTFDTGDGISVSLSNNIRCTKAQIYKTRLEYRASASGTYPNRYPVGEWYQHDFDITKTPYNDRCAMVFLRYDDQVYPDRRISLGIGDPYYSTVTWNMIEGVRRRGETEWSESTIDNQTYAPFSLLYPSNENRKDGACIIETNIPVFETEQDYYDYMLAETEEEAEIAIGKALNYVESEDYDIDETKEWYFFGRSIGTHNYYNGEVSVQIQEPQRAYQTFYAHTNTPPTLYFTNDFQLKLQGSDIIDSYYTPEFEGTANIPDVRYWEPKAFAHDTFWADMEMYYNAKGTNPANGDYYMALSALTNIPVFANKEDADEATETGDYSKAVNPYDINIDGFTPPTPGELEEQTVFGSGGTSSPFIQMFVASRSAVLEISDAFYSDDSSLIDNIERGLKLFGAEPFQAICGLTYYPFDATNLVNVQNQHYIYFGSYYHQLTNSVNRVLSFKPTAYIDAGTVNLRQVSPGYRNFEPYCQLAVYLPYIGWQQLEIHKYINRTVNIRYYVDLNTRACVCALVADNVMMDYFTGEIGIQLPITGQDLSQYANSTMNALLGTAGASVGGAISGAMTGSMAGPYGAIAGAIGGGALSAIGGIFKMSQKGQPKDHLMTKGNFSSGCGAYLPNYVMFRFYLHDVITPANLTAIYGKPSSASGNIGSFSGFLQVDTVKLNTTGMTDTEQAEVLQLLKEGIYV